MNRLEFLEKLEDAVKTETLIEARYTKNINGKTCHCILGHAYKIVGKEKLLLDMPEEFNIKHYDGLIFRDAQYDLKETGLSDGELLELQGLNDRLNELCELYVRDTLLGYINILKRVKPING